MGRKNNSNGSVYGYQPNSGSKNNFGQSKNNNNHGDESKKTKLIIIILLLFFLFLIIVFLLIFLLGGKGKTDPFIKTKVPPPTDLHSTNVTENEIDIEFGKPQGEGEEDISYYDIDISQAKDFSSLDEYKTTDSEEITHNFIDLSPGIKYYIRVYSVSNNEEKSEYIALNETTSSDLPAPTDLQSTKVTEDEIDIKFTKPYDSGEQNIDHYDIEVSKTSDFMNSDISSTTGGRFVTTYNLIGLTSGTDYYIRVYSVSASSEHSSNSNVLHEQTVSTKAPSPSNLHSTNVTQSKIAIEFDKAEGPGFENIKSYGIQVSKTNDFSTFDEYKTGSSSDNSYEIDSLESKVTYYIRVYSIGDGIEDSDFSNIINETTKDTGEGPNLPDIEPRPDVFPSEWGYGSGKNWNDKVYAPFVDMVSSPQADLNVYKDHMKADYFNLGFVQNLAGATALKPDGTIPWGWGGYGLNEDAPSEQYNILKGKIKDYRDGGGDVALSFGGAGGTPFWNSPLATVDSLEKTYELIVKGMGLSRIDYDIEATGIDYDENITNAKATKILQDKTGVQVEITLPVLQGGLVDPGKTILKNYLDAGVDVERVNVMSMCFGSDFGEPGYGDDMIQSMVSLNGQIKDLWKSELGITLTEEQAYNLEGVTPSIGFENKSSPPVSADEWLLVCKFAEEHNLGMLSDWVENRDALEGDYGTTQQSEEGGIKTAWEYGNIGRDNFTDEDFEKETPPQPKPINGFKVDSKDFNSADISWVDDQPNEIETRVYFAKDGDEEYELESAFKDGDSYTFDYLEPNQSYWTVLASVNSNSDKYFSDPIMFTTDPLPEDTEPPKWSEGASLTLNDELSSYNRVYFDFNQATDNVGVSKYVATISKDGQEVDKEEFVNGVDFFDKDPSIEMGFENLELMNTYDLSVEAYDYSGNISESLTKQYDSGDYPIFDYNISQDNAYKKGDIIKFTSTDQDWVDAETGENLYEKVSTWGGWAPDGTSLGNPDSTDYSPGETRPESTAWDHYTVNESIDKDLDENIILLGTDFSNEYIIDRNSYLINEKNKLFYENNVSYDCINKIKLW